MWECSVLGEGSRLFWDCCRFCIIKMRLMRSTMGPCTPNGSLREGFPLGCLSLVPTGMRSGVGRWQSTSMAIRGSLSCLAPVILRWWDCLRFYGQDPEGALPCERRKRSLTRPFTRSGGRTVWERK